ncbi:hypothetical protein M378DRAFT_960458 [Amanita muscaria Koide BX008]|uniref:Nephrocystin 3-like N-terminal domain-containing protein n=1 Tax=Amanita muscaria (strain Koide BX008) TaxID=946122 RepID=A0A0C2WTF9_AMAMK|nr:hypothetical protein M378DRAFT_960458 [Amanita muscaria Koide BX008]
MQYEVSNSTRASRPGFKASTVTTTMLSSTSGASSRNLLQNLQTNMQNNGLNGDGSNNIVNSGNSHFNHFNITQVTTAEGEDVELDRLLDSYVSKDALRNSVRSPPECHPNTRTTIRNQIGWWLDESESKKSPLLWLNGPAAVGKSVIAKTVSGFHDQIVATFFFSTSSDKTAATLFPTLAWQLARRVPGTREHIIASLKSSDSLQTSQVEEQFNLLIIQPLKSTTTVEFRPVMVIDGVDECTDEILLGQFLRVLVQAGGGDDMPVRFIICSRPEPRIHAILGGDCDVNPIRDGSEPRLPRPKLESSHMYMVVTVPVFGRFVIVGSLGFFTLIRTLGIRELFQDTRKYGIFHLFRSIGRYGASESIELYSKFFGFLGLLIGLAGALVLILSGSDLPRSGPTRSRGFLEDVWELYGSIRLDLDKDALSFPTSDRLADTFDKIYPHPVISTIRIGFSQEFKDDMTRYLTDKFNAIRPPGDSICPWFQLSDISDLVEASCGQFLYASTIVRLLDDLCFSPRNVLEMARRSSLPTPDLNELYKAILKRAQEGSPDYQFVKDSLAILVFFAGNVHFLTVRKNFPVIEFLLGLEKGELNGKLYKMHSVLSIVPGESVGVYHRSFLEFLLDHKRSGEYHIAYSNGLQQILILMIQVGFRYHIMRFRLQSRLVDLNTFN